MSGYEVVSADGVRDRDSVLALWSRNLEAHDPAEHAVRYDWYHRNPVGEPRIWFVKKDGDAVGTVGLNLRRVSVDGARLSAGVVGDFAVDARHRLLQAALTLQKAVLGSLEEDVDLIYGLPNRNAIRVFERQGYRECGTLSRYVKVLRTGRYMQSAKGLLAAAKPLAVVADAVLRLRSPETWRRLGAGRAIEPVSTFDERFNDLWNRIGGTLAAVIGVRTADFLRWRYTECPLQRYTTVALTGDAGRRVIGYIVWYAGEDKQVRVADWVTDGSAGAAEDLVSGLIAAARRGGAASVSCEFFGTDSLAHVLKRFGFVQRECAARLAVAAKPENRQSLLERCKSWHFLRGDENVNTL